MRLSKTGRWWLAGWLCLVGPSWSQVGSDARVRLFILSGQSNMARFDPDVSFKPALKKAFPADELIVVKSAQGGQPIRRWLKAWKAPAGLDSKAGPIGDLYDVLMARVREATKGKTIDTITFVWMQGEADAQRGPANLYEESLRGLIQQLRDDLKRPDMTVVIGRLSEFKKGQPGWDTVRTAQVRVAESDPRSRWVDTDEINGGKAALHYTPKGYAEMGRRFAARCVELLSKNQQPK